MSLVEHFVTSQDSGYVSDTAIVRRIVTSLHNQTVEFGENVITKGASVIGIMFIKEHGVTALGILDSVRLLDFYEYSFFGEWEVIFETNAERSYVAVNRHSLFDAPTQVYYIKPNDFHAILDEFEEFDKFQRTRAIRRRAYIRFVEQEVQDEVYEFHENAKKQTEFFEDDSNISIELSVDSAEDYENIYERMMYESK